MIPIQIAHRLNDMIGQSIVNAAIGMASAHQGNLRIAETGQSVVVIDDTHTWL
jgi:hypothetical protein